MLDWHDELQRLVPKLPELPTAAQRAVSLVVADFVREDAEGIAEALDDDEALDPFPEAA